MLRGDLCGNQPVYSCVTLARVLAGFKCITYAAAEETVAAPVAEEILVDKLDIRVGKVLKICSGLIGYVPEEELQVTRFYTQSYHPRWQTSYAGALLVICARGERMYPQWAPIAQGEREYTRSGHQSRKGRENIPAVGTNRCCQTNTLTTYRVCTQGRPVVVLCNLKARNMAGIKSNGMLLAASDAAHEVVQLVRFAATRNKSVPLRVRENIPVAGANRERGERVYP
eukprot:1178650-Prorocentrum_minimum.AAC.1